MKPLFLKGRIETMRALVPIKEEYNIDLQANRSFEKWKVKLFKEMIYNNL